MWEYINNKDWTEAAKYRCFLLIAGAVSAVAGFGAWLIIRNWTLSSVEWMICFIGYPVVIACFAAMIYSFRHDFK